MKIVVTGGNGFLGQHLCVYLSTKKFDVIAVSRGVRNIPAQYCINYYKIDLTNAIAVKQMIQSVNPDVIIHAAAMSKPDECDNNKEECLRQNVEATKYLLNAAHALKEKLHFIYISTDFIFGENGPHSEEDKPAPLNFYGDSKLRAEQLVKHSGINFSIVRPVFIYGANWEGLRGSFLHWIKTNLEQHKPIKVVSDQQRTPTYAGDICKGIETMMLKKICGEFHLAGKDLLSPYEMAIITARVLKLNESLIENVTSETFFEPVKRAKRSGLKIEKAKRELGYEPVSFEEGVRLTFNIN